MEDTFIARNLGNHRWASQANDQSKVRQHRHVDTSLTISGSVEQAINARLTPCAQARSFWDLRKNCYRALPLLRTFLKQWKWLAIPMEIHTAHAEPIGEFIHERNHKPFRALACPIGPSCKVIINKAQTKESWIPSDNRTHQPFEPNRSLKSIRERISRSLKLLCNHETINSDITLELVRHLKWAHKDWKRSSLHFSFDTPECMHFYSPSYTNF